MNRFIALLILLMAGKLAGAQSVQEIYFNLYTDSLKKGVHNYINVDGKLSNGRWLPLTNKELTFSADYGQFKGNDLVLPANPVTDKVTVKVVLKDNPEIKKEITIWIKQLPDPELPKYDKKRL
ncbi:MAG: hypothetical protein QM727_03540 [Niabella sp.]